jgi:hypothetical protein
MILSKGLTSSWLANDISQALSETLDEAFTAFLLRANHRLHKEILQSVTQTKSETL